MKVIPYVRNTKIGKPGVYVGVPMALYHGELCVGPSVSSSGLRTISDESPAHYYVDSYLNPDREEQEPSEAFILGRATHCIILGDEVFSTQFIMRPEKIGTEAWQSNKTICKQWLKDQVGEGRTVLLSSQIKQIRGMAHSLARHPLVQAGILNGLVEHSMVWKDKETGVWVKARPDTIPNDSGDFSDLKTTVSVGAVELMRTMAECAYHQQAALIGEGFEVLTGQKMTSFNLVFVEKKPPYCTRIVTLKDCDLVRGQQQNRFAIRTFADCVARGEWPGPGSDDAEYMELPGWKQTQTPMLVLTGRQRQMRSGKQT